MDLIGPFVHPVGRDGVKGVILANWKNYFSTVGENMLQHPSNNISFVMHG